MKEKHTAIILALFLGGLGFHKFYLGRYAQGLIYLFFSWTFIPAIIGLAEGLYYISYSQERWDRDFNPSLSGPDVWRDEKKCPDCAELVLAEAKKCKHCGALLVA